MDYKSKYLKYKTKYLNLSKIQSGGTIIRYNTYIPIRYCDIFLDTETQNKLLVLLYLNYNNPKSKQLNPERLQLLENEHPNVLKYIDQEKIDENITKKIKQYYYSYLSDPINNYYIFDLGPNEFHFLESLVRYNNEGTLIFNQVHFTMSDDHKESMIYDIINGYTNIYTNELPIVINIDNIIIQYNTSTQNLNAKIIPFDTHVMVNSGIQTFIPDKGLCPPENFTGAPIINEKSCVFYLGSIFHYILSNGISVYPDFDTNLFEMIEHMRNPSRYNEFDVSPKLLQYKDLTMRMLQKNPDDRPRLHEIHNTLYSFKQLHLIKPATRQSDISADDE
jgi:hypothetical protein